MNRDILGSLGVVPTQAFKPPQIATSHCVSSGWCGMSLEVGWTDSPWGSLSPTIQSLNSCSFDFVGKNTRCIRTAHASGPSTGWIRWSSVTSLTAPMYIYAHCLFHLLSGSRAARLHINWLIDWIAAGQGRVELSGRHNKYKPNNFSSENLTNSRQIFSQSVISRPASPTITLNMSCLKMGRVTHGSDFFYLTGRVESVW